MALFAGQVQTAPYQSPDYGPSVAAARELAMTGAQGIAGMVGQVGDYFKQQGEKKKALKAASTQIQAALTLMPELSPVLSGISNNIKDENISLDDRFAEASIVGDLIKNSISAMQSQQMMNLRQQKFAASQGGGGGGGGKKSGGDSGSSTGGFNPFE
jgi:conjugal transfer/entry exclusion protein